MVLSFYPGADDDGRPVDLEGILNSRLTAARNAVRSGQYQLVLGAGASIGARTNAGPLPDAGRLVASLAKRYPEGRIELDMRLPRAYQRAVQVSDSDDVWWYLKTIFSGCTHEPWFTTLAGVPWRRVWTLNIDDAFESAYASSVRRKFAELRVIDWVDEYVEPRGPELIHLHGQVSGKAPTPIVFSMSEYHAAAEAHGVWHKVLGGVLSSEPVVIVGARILDDLDVERLVLNARPHADAPSMIVDPFISAGNAWELENAGFVIVRDAASNWITSWTELFGLDPDQLATIYQSRATNLPQISELHPDRVPPPPLSHDVLGGSEPLWSDACAGYIAEFEWMATVTAQLRNWVAAPNPGVFVRVAYVPRLAGATAGLMKIARGACALGIRVLQFDKSVRFDTQRLLDICTGSGPTLLLVDGGHGFVDDFDDLARRAHQLTHTSLYILLADRPNHSSVIEDHLSADKYPLEVGRMPLRRTRRDARSMVSVLKYQGRLGLLESSSESDRINHFYGRDIFISQSEVEHGAGFRARLNQEIRLLTTKWHRDLVILLTLASDGGVQVSLTEAAFALDTSVESLLTALHDSDQLGALVEVDGDLLLARHRLRSVDALVRDAGGATFLATLATMLRRLAKLVSKAGYARSRGSSLVRHLMSAKMLRAAFPNADASSLYQQILPEYGEWNARYWEQRSIYARLAQDWDRAVSFAERAVSVWDDSFTRNTLGVNLLAKATDMAVREDPAWGTYYTLAKGEFVKALDRERSTSVTRWARLSSTLDLIAALADRAAAGQLRESPEEVLDDWSASYAEFRIALPRITGSQSVEEVEHLSTRYAALRSQIESATLRTNQLPNDGKSDVSSEIRRQFDRLTEPTPLAIFAGAVARSIAEDLRSHWGGYGTFKRALLDAVPDAVITPEKAGTLHPSAPDPHPRAGVRQPPSEREFSEAIKNVIHTLDRPTTLGAVAARVKQSLRLEDKHGWGDHRSFKEALLAAVPDVQVLSDGPGYVVPPEGDSS